MTKQICSECMWFDLTELRCYNHQGSRFMQIMSMDNTCATCDICEAGMGREAEFCLVEMPQRQGRNWMMLDHVNSKAVYRNRKGGYLPRSVAVPIETVRADNFGELDWTKTYLNKAENGAGWLDRMGRFYGCPMEKHDDHAELILCRDVQDIERRGWVRVLDRHRYICLKQLTAEQRMWLDRHGYEVEDDRHL